MFWNIYIVLEQCPTFIKGQFYVYLSQTWLWHVWQSIFRFILKSTQLHHTISLFFLNNTVSNVFYTYHRTKKTGPRLKCPCFPSWWGDLFVYFHSFSSSRIDLLMIWTVFLPWPHFPSILFKTGNFLHLKTWTLNKTILWKLTSYDNIRICEFSSRRWDVSYPPIKRFIFKENVKLLSYSSRYPFSEEHGLNITQYLPIWSYITEMIPNIAYMVRRNGRKNDRYCRFYYQNPTVDTDTEILNHDVELSFSFLSPNISSLMKTDIIT